ncbi:MAG: trypsin-like peptidase domain-containing protein [Termitinemataceae bacterium]|nr:MAG: trypsin-like peptidase domain-containing protein [Termitinemataceae bacterium]
MKNNSPRSRFLFVGISILIASLFAAGLGVINLPFLKSGATKEIAKENAKNNSGELNLRQSPGSQNIQINTAELSQYTIDEKENIAVYEQLNEAVVNITTETQAYNWFLEPVPQDGTSGSGTIIDTRGLVLTNNHVIENAIKVFVNLADGTQIEGSVKGTDPENDLAVIEFKPPKDVDLKTIPFGDSENLKVGQKVLAIGNPFAFERTLSVGIVSGLGRPIQTSNRNIIRGMIQTDASINPGNSGGPLLDAQGKMIGVTTMIYSPSGGSVGIGFAVPVNTAKRVVSELITYGKMRRGWFDATLVQVFPALVRYAKLSVNSGMLVSRTTKNGLAEKAGLKQGNDAVRYGSSVIYLGGDIITSVDGLKTDTLADLYSALEDNKGGDKIDVEVLRDGKTVKLKITLADRDEVLK